MVKTVSTSRTHDITTLNPLSYLLGHSLLKSHSINRCGYITRYSHIHNISSLSIHGYLERIVFNIHWKCDHTPPTLDPNVYQGKIQPDYVAKYVWGWIFLTMGLLMPIHITYDDWVRYFDPEKAVHTLSRLNRWPH